MIKKKNKNKTFFSPKVTQALYQELPSSHRKLAAWVLQRLLGLPGLTQGQVPSAFQRGGTTPRLSPLLGPLSDGELLGKASHRTHPACHAEL